jgi:hypothetical protein
MDGDEVKSSEWEIVDYVDDWNYRLEMDWIGMVNRICYNNILI